MYTVGMANAEAMDRYITGNYGMDQDMCDGACDELGYDDELCHCDELPDPVDEYTEQLISRWEDSIREDWD